MEVHRQSVVLASPQERNKKFIPLFFSIYLVKFHFYFTVSVAVDHMNACLSLSYLYSMVIVRTTWCLVGLAAASIVHFTVPGRSNKPNENEEESKIAECVVYRVQKTPAS